MFQKMEVDEYKYFGLYPCSLFECFTGTHCMHFILSLKHTSPNEAKELKDILYVSIFTTNHVTKQRN